MKADQKKVEHKMYNSIELDASPILAHTKPFIDIITQHVCALPTAQWDKFRQRAEKTAPVDYKLSFNPDLTPQTIAAEEMTEHGIPLQAIMAFFKKYEQIGAIAGRPVYYFPEQGMYYWPPSNLHGRSLSLWLTAPAYPIGW